MTGLIVKGIAGFYYVRTEDGTVYQCKARGVFKKDKITPMIGDVVDITVPEIGDAVIDRIHERKNEFIRPPVSNVDMFVIVTAIKDPDPVPAVLDKFLVMAEKSHTEIAICVNKTDLATSGEIEKLVSVYENLYPVFLVSAEKGIGIDKLEKHIAGKHAALAGPSGAGKSTILNALKETELMETGSVSHKTGRGRHTTRHVEIFEMPSGGMIFDTPGFTSFEVLDADEEELQFLYPEMKDFIGKCKYDNCRHLREPECAVRNAVSEGYISKERYRSYLTQLLEIKEREKTKYD